MSENEFTSYCLTKKEYDVLISLRKRPWTAKALYRKAKPSSDEQWSIWLSDLSPLYYTEPENAKLLAKEGKIILNDKGITVAQAEYDRRFDMYYTRVISIMSLAVSIISTAIALLAI